jgi:hypothetical protein
VWANDTPELEFFQDNPRVRLDFNATPDGVTVGNALDGLTGEDSGTYFSDIVIPSGKTYKVTVSRSAIVFTDGLGEVYVILSESCTYTPPHSFAPPKRPLAPAGQLAAVTPISIPVSNEADSFDVTCDRRFAVVVGENTPHASLPRGSRVQAGSGYPCFQRWQLRR